MRQGERKVFINDSSTLYGVWQELGNPESFTQYDEGK